MGQLGKQAASVALRGWCKRSTSDCILLSKGLENCSITLSGQILSPAEVMEIHQCSHFTPPTGLSGNNQP